MNEPSPTEAPGYYTCQLTNSLPPASYKSRVYRGDSIIDEGFVSITSATQGLATIDDISSQFNQTSTNVNTDNRLAQLTEEVAPGQYRFTAMALSQAVNSHGVVVNEFSSTARAQLAGISINFHQPVWTSDGLHRPIVRGDSYRGPLAITFSISGWPGPDLATASVIMLSASRLPSGDTQFQWPVRAVVLSSEIQLQLELTAEQTNHPAGLYEFDVEARWTDGTVQTLIGPDARFRIVQDHTY